MTNKLEQISHEFSRRLSDLRREESSTENFDVNSISTLLKHSKDCFHETKLNQDKLLKQLNQIETALIELNRILRLNADAQTKIEQSHEQLERNAQLMALNAEALECRAAAIQLQQQSKFILNRTIEMEKRANQQLAQHMTAIQMKSASGEPATTTVDIQKSQADTTQTSAKSDVKLNDNERHSVLTSKSEPIDDGFQFWPIREFMNQDKFPSCILRISPNSQSMSVDIKFLPVTETEYLLDNHEELISAPIDIHFDEKINNGTTIILAIPHQAKRSNHRENVIKVRQATGQWIAVDTNESQFDTHKEKHFVQCRLDQASKCAVVSRLRQDQILIEKQARGLFTSSADGRFTMQWPEQIVQNSFSVGARLQPIDPILFNEFCREYFHDCQGLIAVGPIIELSFDEVILLKPIQFTVPILVPSKKKIVTTTVNNVQPDSNLSAQDQQRSIFESMLENESNTEQLVLLYAGFHDQTWYIDKDISLKQSKTHDTITTQMQSLHNRMIVARYDRQQMSIKQLQEAISLLDQTINHRSMIVILRQRLQNPSDLCLICCSTQNRTEIEQDLQQENYSSDSEQIKQVSVQEGQLLEICFRSNIQPVNVQQRSVPFVFNTNFPFFFETKLETIDRYAQNLSPNFYGFLQICLRSNSSERVNNKDVEKKKTITDQMKADISISNTCITEFLIRLPKANYEVRLPTQKALTTFTGEGVLTPTLFRDLAANLSNDEWHRLARRLGMTSIRVEAIERDHREDSAYYMLLTWFKRVSKAADKSLILINSLKLINRRDLASDLQSMKDDKRFEQATKSREDQSKLLTVAFHRICQREECVRIWKQLARELSLLNDEIQTIDHQYATRQERCLRALQKWSQNEPLADILCLAKILRTLGFKTLAREIDDMI